MPNRLIKETIRTSKSVNTMTDFQFRLWAYLITYVDDYGRGSADPEIIKGFVFPRRKSVTEKTIAATLADLAIMGSILLYDVDGESYLCFPNWSKHQRVQNKQSKFPAPEDAQPQDMAFHGESPWNTVGHGDSRWITVDHGESPPESNPIQSKSESKSESNPKRAGAREEDFERFWKAYPKKKARETAHKAFFKLNPDGELLEKMIRSIGIQRTQKEWTKDDGAFIPYPATWLNQKRWQDTAEEVQTNEPSEWDFYKEISDGLYEDHG